jgi:hypothetical protein
MRVFRACRVPDSRFPRRLASDKILQSLGVRNSLLAGKNAGNFGDSAAFRENLCRKPQQMQGFEDEFPTQRAGNFFGRAEN